MTPGTKLRFSQNRVWQIVNFESKDDEKTSKERNSALGIAVVEYNAAISAHQGETDPDKKELLYTKRIRAEVKMRSISERLTDSGPLAVFKSGYEDNALTNNLAWVDQQLAAVAAKKETLPV